MNKIQVSVVIVNFNSLSLISDCVDSIIENCTSIDYEIIVVSNSDEEPSEINALKNKLPTITYLETGSNLGFAKANNIGAKKASGEYLFFLNPDTILINDVLDILYKKINRS
ncbi:MAG TPA: glycosyltransferase family 2 protein, partial [Balneola sp.]|nr:glycosyltransferase family 2 protein [Balneola sp.]